MKETVFDAYAAYYDLLYRDKDYAAEVDYVHALIKHYVPAGRDLLELGCGTGRHAEALARLGYRVTGVDRSDAMVAQARLRAPGLTFVQGDLCDFRTGRTFDVVLALFHVMSYQTTNADLIAAFKTAAAHLAPGGVFIFDCWYGPGVLSDPPTTRVKRLHGDGVEVTRIAEPVHYPDANRVDVHYEVIVESQAGIQRIREVHPMRYLFTPEVDLLLDAAGMRRLAAQRWLDGRALGADAWNACYIAGR
ncbi:class I SAM-dependent methyltransferase [Caldichromatium japonicum]|uniref:Class I SAM-dependent methyltransferase n=1 Tax=Caldichromatium japonicum TaxID=2699430 RepID=A0A6G7VAF0_9GAMM|nr:class I SAM-dependent methyltransferase [Caldichromatium japonicum]QIK36954.1 class I SAM-dependent methyltransferase [Caldichromatium japonicum]